MLPLVQDFSWEVDRVADPLVLRMRRRVLGILDRVDILLLDTLIVASCFDRGPLVWGHCSFVRGHLMNSIALEGGDLVPSDRHIAYSRSKTGDSVCCLGRGFVGRDPSI